MMEKTQRLSKACFKCGLTKPLTHFYKHQRMADGHLNKCKECAKRDVRAHRILNPEKLAQYEKKRSQNPQRRLLHTLYGRAAAARYPHKYKARNMVSNYKRDGKLHKMPCAVCGDLKAEAHHTDYTKPLDVVWLCGQHHREAHQAPNMMN